MTGPGQRLLPQQTPPTMNGRRAGGLPAAALSTRSRPKGYLALAVALIVGLGALGYYFYTTAGSKTPVVVAGKDGPGGHTITRGGLGTGGGAGGVAAGGGDPGGRRLGGAGGGGGAPRPPVE